MSDNEEQEGQSNDAMTDDEKLADEWGAAMEESGDSENSVDDEWAAAMAEAEAVEGEDGAASSDNVQAAPLESFENAVGQSGGLGVNPDLDVILDIPVMISMEVGSTQIPIRNLLQLNQGSVVELDRLAGEPLDVLVNGTLIAHGEVVMVNEKFGIRLTDVVSPSERIKRLS